MGNNFKYSLKVLFRSKSLLFWTFIFPILLGIFFYMAFSDIEKNEKLDVIDIAIINNDDFLSDEIFKNSFLELSQGENKLFDIIYTDLDRARLLLDDKEITGYLLIDDDINVYVNSNGINETIFRYVVDEISSNKRMIDDMATMAIEEEIDRNNYNIDYNKIYDDVVKLVYTNNANLNDITLGNLSYTMIEYYTLIAMACLYGGMLSMFITNYKLANMSGVGKRVAVSPIHKGKMLLGSFLASYIVQLIGIAILFLFTYFCLGISYGDNIGLVILLSCFGSLAGLSFGVLVATLVKAHENTKIGIMIAITMLWCFLSGMMGITMKYVVDKNIPILNMINPASMITDGFYSLYYYHTLDRFIFDVSSLGVFSIIMLGISIGSLRRQKYECI